MNDSVIFDTHEFIKGAIDAGIEPQAAEYLAHQVTQGLKTNLVSKENLRTEIVGAKYDLLKWIIVLLVAQGGLVIAGVGIVVQVLLNQLSS